MKNTFVFVLLMVCLQRTAAQTLQDGIQASHQGKYYRAEAIFRDLLSKDKKNISLLLASGFNNAWNKEYKVAKERFKKVLELQPANKDAKKGMAYVYLYEGSYVKAASAFENMLAANPSSQEYRMALALSYMNLQKKGKALHEFEKILQLNPAHQEAQKYIQEIKAGRGIIELSALAGNTIINDQSRFGFRQLQAAVHINSENFVYLRYDNALSLDNYFLLKTNEKNAGYFGGIYSRWHQRIGSKFEFGTRNLGEKGPQQIFQTEQLLFLPKNFIAKMGGSYVTGAQQPAEWMLMGGVSAPLNKKISIEPNYFFIQRQAREQRVLISAKYMFNPRADFGIGIYNGRERLSKTNVLNKTNGVYSFVNFPIFGPLKGTANARYEKDALGQNVFIAAAGIKISFNKKGFTIQN